MLRHQWVEQKAREMALHYVAHAGVVYSPDVFIQKVREMEGYLAVFYSRSRRVNLILDVGAGTLLIGGVFQC